MSKNMSENMKVDSELQEALVAVNRVAKVVKGGRRFSFSVLMIVGNGKGSVGYGLGKANEVTEARAKATQSAKKNMIKVSLREGRTLHHDVIAKFCAGVVKLRSAPPGTGVIAGGPVRIILSALGVKDAVAKSIGSSNVHNMVGATFKALKMLSSAKLIAERRAKKISEILDN